MQKQIVATMCATVAMLGATTGFVAPTASADDAPQATAAAKAPPWVMPDVRKTLLQRAVDAVYAVTGTEDIDLRTVAAGNQNVFNYSNWDVCRQSPSTGKEIPQKTKRVILYVSRPGSC